MGFIKDLGKLVGCVAGATIGAPIAVVGEIVNSDFLQEVGEGVYKATERTGEMLGNVAEGTVETAYGLIKEDTDMQSKGVGKVIDSGATYISGVAKGVGKIAVTGIETVEAIIDGDSDKAIKVGKEVVKTVAVGALAVGVADVLDGANAMNFDNEDTFADMDNEDNWIENPNMHHVTPHERTLADGRTIWVDGDGNTNVNTYGGWYQSNPNYKA